MLTVERKEATKRTLRELARLRSARKLPAEFTPGTPLVIALENEYASDVMARVTRYSPPVVLAVYFPQTSRLEVLTLRPGGLTQEGDSDAVMRTHRDSTIGMVVDASGPIAVPGQWVETYDTQKFDLAGA